MADTVEKRIACEVDGGKHVRPCWALEMFVEGPSAFSKTKGIHVWSMSSMETGQRTRTYYGFKNMGPTEHRKGGLLINYCPFCGTNISAPFRQDDDGAAA